MVRNLRCKLMCFDLYIVLPRIALCSRSSPPPPGFHRGNASSPSSHMFTSAGNRSSDAADSQHSSDNRRCQVFFLVATEKMNAPRAFILPPTIVSMKVSHSFCVLNSAQHGCKEAGKECHFSFLCSTFYPQICFYFSFHMKGTSEGALFSEHLSIGAISIKRSARIRSFSALKPFLESVNVLVSHTSAHFL